MADKQKILQLIEQAAKEGRTSLDLRNNQLTSAPPEITKLTSLTQFYLEGNQLPILPETLGNPNDVKTIFTAIARGKDAGGRRRQGRQKRRD